MSGFANVSLLGTLRDKGRYLECRGPQGPQGARSAVQFVTLVSQLVQLLCVDWITSSCNLDIQIVVFVFVTSQLLNFSSLFLLQSTSFCPQFWAHRHLYREIDDDVDAPLSALSLAPGRSDSSAFLGSSRVYTPHIHNEQYASSFKKCTELGYDSMMIEGMMVAFWVLQESPSPDSWKPTPHGRLQHSNRPLYLRLNGNTKKKGTQVE